MSNWRRHRAFIGEKVCYKYCRPALQTSPLQSKLGLLQPAARTGLRAYLIGTQPCPRSWSAGETMHEVTSGCINYTILSSLVHAKAWLRHCSRSCHPRSAGAKMGDQFWVWANLTKPYTDELQILSSCACQGRLLHSKSASWLSCLQCAYLMHTAQLSAAGLHQLVHEYETPGASK